MNGDLTGDEASQERARAYTTKQMGDACEMLVAAELTLAGVPALKASDYWPGYDVIAQPPGASPQRISVKSRTFISHAHLSGGQPSSDTQPSMSSTGLLS